VRWTGAIRPRGGATARTSRPSARRDRCCARDRAQGGGRRQSWPSHPRRGNELARWVMHVGLDDDHLSAARVLDARRGACASHASAQSSSRWPPCARRGVPRARRSRRCSARGRGPPSGLSQGGAAARRPARGMQASMLGRRPACAATRPAVTRSEDDGRGTGRPVVASPGLHGDPAGPSRGQPPRERPAHSVAPPERSPSSAWPGSEWWTRSTEEAIAGRMLAQVVAGGVSNAPDDRVVRDRLTPRNADPDAATRICSRRCAAPRCRSGARRTSREGESDAARAGHPAVKGRTDIFQRGGRVRPRCRKEKASEGFGNR